MTGLNLGGLRFARPLEAGAAQHRPALSGLEGNCRLGAALRTGGPRLRTHPLRSARALGLALLAVLGVVLELFIVEKNLLACREHKLRAAIDAPEHSIREFHGRLPLTGTSAEIGHGL